MLDFVEFSFNGAHHSDIVLMSVFTLPFSVPSGTGIEYIGSLGDSGSILSVHLDGSEVYRFDRYNPTYVCATSLYRKSGMTHQYHTIVVRLEATSGPLAKPYLQVKEFQ